MPKKKKKKTKTKKKFSKKRKRKSKTRRRIYKKIRRIKKKKKNKDNDNSTPELIIKTKPEWVKQGLANKSQYQKKYKDSIKNNDGFWKKEGKRITWIKPYKKIKEIKYSAKEVKIKWFHDGTLNAYLYNSQKHSTYHLHTI